MVDMLHEIDGVVCPTPRVRSYAYPVGGRRHRQRTIPQQAHCSSADLAAVILDEAEVAVVPGGGLWAERGYFASSYALGDDDSSKSSASRPSSASSASRPARRRLHSTTYRFGTVGTSESQGIKVKGLKKHALSRRGYRQPRL